MHKAMQLRDTGILAAVARAGEGAARRRQRARDLRVRRMMIERYGPGWYRTIESEERALQALHLAVYGEVRTTTRSGRRRIDFYSPAQARREVDAAYGRTY
jgi:hypothetical protein